MDKSAVLKILSRFEAILKPKIGNVELVLYGSYANGIPSEGSDIDVVVISDGFSNRTYWERIDILSDAIYEVFAPIEAIAMTPEEWEDGDSLIALFAHTGETIS